MASQHDDILLETRNDLVEYLEKTQYEYVLIKFHAQWCAPCKYIGPKVHEMVNKKVQQLDREGKTNKFILIEVDVDECFDLYAFMKSKKMLKGIPAIFLYKKEIYMQSDPTQRFIPQSTVSGAKEVEIQKIIDLIN